MDLENIISIAGYSGLHKVVGSTKNGIVVESLEDGKRMAAYSTHKVSALDDISIFTETEDVPLKDVFQKMHDTNKGKAGIGHKSSADELKTFFEKSLPDYDKDRVYISDIKKVIRWYNLLIESGLLKPEVKEDKKSKKDTSTGSASTKTKAKPKAKTAKPKTTKVKAPKASGAKGKMTKSTSLKSK
ncbi:MAG: DUF5606 domain-containing protein [Flavobacteriales bacterium]|nr:DUF5606 domain-containing protein [Flavobacteriales bacterium]